MDTRSFLTYTEIMIKPLISEETDPDFNKLFNDNQNLFQAKNKASAQPKTNCGKHFITGNSVLGGDVMLQVLPSETASQCEQKCKDIERAESVLSDPYAPMH